MDIILIACLEGFIFPYITRISGGHPLRPLPKIIIGLFACVLACAAAGIVQVYIDDSEPGAVSMAWQLPQYLFISIAEILVDVSALEFAYDDSPVHLRNMVTSLWCLCQAAGNLLDVVLFLAMASVADWILYYLFGLIMLVSTVWFCFHVRTYTYAEFLHPVSSAVSISDSVATLTF